MATNNIVALDVRESTSESCFEAQVSALLSTSKRRALNVITVLVDPNGAGSTVIHSGTDSQVVMDFEVNAFLPTPSPGRGPRPPQE